MSVSWPGSMRGPRVKTPLLLLLLLIALTGTVLCQEDSDVIVPEDELQKGGTDDPDAGDDGDPDIPEPVPTVSDATSAPDPSPTEEGDSGASIEEDHGSGHGRSFVEGGDEETTEDPDHTDPTPTDNGEGLSPIIILIPVVLVVVIIGIIVCGIFINRKWNIKARNQEQNKEDPYLDGSSTEKVPMPMFEEDVPSVLELEMEELDQWMKKDGETPEDSKHA